MKKIVSFLNSGLFLLILGFGLTTIVGTYINQEFQKATWEREKKFQLLSARLVQGEKLVDELSQLINAQFYSKCSHFGVACFCSTMFL